MLVTLLLPEDGGIVKLEDGTKVWQLPPGETVITVPQQTLFPHGPVGRDEQKDRLTLTLEAPEGSAINVGNWAVNLPQTPMYFVVDCAKPLKSEATA